jgi:hypothetical protein
MTKPVTPVLAAFALVGISYAYADATRIGEISKIEANRVSLVSEPKPYECPEGHVSKLMVGNSVKITYTTDNSGTNKASACDKI